MLTCISPSPFIRHCSQVKMDKPVKVIQVGLEDEESDLGSQSNSADNSGSGSNNSDSPSASTNEGKNVDNLVVFDGLTGAKTREDHLIINGNKVITSAFQHAPMDVEGDTSTIIKAFCNLPLSYEEFSWVEGNAPLFLPDLKTMTDKEMTIHRIQMLQLQLQRIQTIEEKQALGHVLTPANLNMMSQR